MLRCVAVCCSVLPCVAVCCSVVRCVAVCYSVLKCVAVRVAVYVRNLDLSLGLEFFESKWGFS